MNILAVDTSTKNLSIAVTKDDKVLAYKNIRLNKILSSSIIPCIVQVLKKAEIPLKKIDGFAVGLGPGSFTSLRVGLSTIKGLAFVTEKPVVGIPSLDVLAMNVPHDNAQICTLCDAKRNLLYSCLFEKKKGQLIKKGKYRLSDIKETLTYVNGKTYFIGDGIELFQDEIRRGVKGFSLADEKLWFPQAKNLAVLSLKRFKKNQHDNIDQMVPLYLYQEDCQVR